jgi:hypothetical protein
MSATSETPPGERQILILGPYGVLGTGVIDAVAENPKWVIITAARRPAPTYRAQAAPPSHQRRSHGPGGYDEGLFVS